MLLIMSDSWWSAVSVYSVSYPEQLSTYLSNIREFRLNDVYGAGQVLLDLTRLPSLESLTVVGAGRGLAVNIDIARDLDAVSLIEGALDQELIDNYLAFEHNTRHHEPGRDPSYLLWFEDLLRQGDRTFRVFREKDYNFKITKIEEGGRMGRLQRFMRLRFDADSRKLVKIVSARCSMGGEWNMETIELCACINQEAGITDPHKIDNGSGLKYPVQQQGQLILGDMVILR